MPGERERPPRRHRDALRRRAHPHRTHHLNERLKIAVMLGGTSDEREVSLSSGCQVAAALREAGHEVVAFDTRDGLLTAGDEARILGSGVREAPAPDRTLDLVTGGNASALTRTGPVGSADVFFLALHGGTGEDGTLQGVLDVMGKAYTGSSMLGAALAMDKEVTKRLLREAGIPTPDWLTDPEGPDEVEAGLGLPVIVKAARGGSSLRLLLAHDRAELEQAMEVSQSFGDVVLYERYVRGRELTVGILGDQALPVGEIISSHELFDYETKYQPGLAQEIFPADIPNELATTVQEMARRVHELLRMRDFSRVDFIVDEADRPWCLEANALPGMTGNSLLPKAARAAGISFPELCDRIARLAAARARQG